MQEWNLPNFYVTITFGRKCKSGLLSFESPYIWIIDTEYYEIGCYLIVLFPEICEFWFLLVLYLPTFFALNFSLFTLPSAPLALSTSVPFSLNCVRMLFADFRWRGGKEKDWSLYWRNYTIKRQVGLHNCRELNHNFCCCEVYMTLLWWSTVVSAHAHTFLTTGALPQQPFA